MAMEMVGAVPYLGMVVSQFALVGLLIASKEAILDGMSSFTFGVYSNILTALILIPSSFILNRSNRPPICWEFLLSCFLIGLFGFLMQMFGMVGTLYASPSLASAILNLVPGFTFLFAVLLRLEMVEFKRLSTIAKTIGTVVGITGALVSTLYRGPSLLMIPSSSHLHFSSLKVSSHWVLGGLLLSIASVSSSLLIISQALVLKKYPAELVITFFYSCFVAILSATSSLIIDRDINSWRLNSRSRLLAILFAGLFGNVSQVTIVAWCVRKKGALFAATFYPLGIVIATCIGVIFQHEIFCLGSLIGSIIIVIGFYFVMWGKAKEKTVVDQNGKAPLLDSKDDSLA